MKKSKIRSKNQMCQKSTLLWPEENITLTLFSSLSKNSTIKTGFVSGCHLARSSERRTILSEHSLETDDSQLGSQRRSCIREEIVLDSNGAGGDDSDDEEPEIAS